MGEHVRLRTGEVIFARVADDAEADWFPAAVDVTAGVVEAENCQVVTSEGELCDLRGYARRNPGLQRGSNPQVIVQVADQPREPSALVQALRAAERASRPVACGPSGSNAAESPIRQSTSAGAGARAGRAPGWLGYGVTLGSSARSR